ncbi:response regulator [Phenylobacterium sp.]|uniref:response regulator n=1 Tax=Phenylobacterium sp. TaxID=1871053 RepID=UPI002BC7192C|nr:response regulator [Phenylobacterium sp.]HLZ74737.1 response regulator [Phenylobacterium sp.]
MYPQANQAISNYLNLQDLAVLVLDDNANTRTLISEVLRGLGVRRIYRTGTCSEGLMILRSHAIDVMFVDIEMDGEDGLEFVRLIRSAPEPKIANAAAIIVSSHATEARVMEAGVVGADGFLSKPFTVGAFAKRLTEGLAARRFMSRRPAKAAARAANQIEL